MSKYYTDYVWKEGIPYGIAGDDSLDKMPEKFGYKIAMDPYRKRISIEKYENGLFHSVVYDSAFLDFRSLKPAEQAAWQKTVLTESPQTIKCIIRNQDDRVLFIEEYTFEKNLCRKCQVVSPHGITLSVQKIFYVLLSDSFNGVMLYDSNGHLVMFKKYQADATTGEFLELLEENWNTNI